MHRGQFEKNINVFVVKANGPIVFVQTQKILQCRIAPQNIFNLQDRNIFYFFS